MQIEKERGRPVGSRTVFDCSENEISNGAFIDRQPAEKEAEKLNELRDELIDKSLIAVAICLQAVGELRNDADVEAIADLRRLWAHTQRPAEPANQLKAILAGRPRQ